MCDLDLSAKLNQKPTTTKTFSQVQAAGPTLE